jgi:nucleotide-binding universal stress UspA family protein
MFYEVGMTQTLAGYKCILLPIDFTEHCARTADHALWIAQQSGGTLHLAHVVENPLDPIYTPNEVQHWFVVEHANKKALEMLEATATRCLPAALPRQLHVLGGDPAEKLVELAAAIPADLIVMSTHGTSSIAHLLLGDIAEKVARQAHCPILLVRVPRE